MKMIDILAEAFDFTPLMSEEPDFLTFSIKVGCNFRDVDCT